MTTQHKEELIVREARELLKNSDLLYLYMSLVVRRWKHAAEQNLSNTSMNRRAWLGQAACCFYAFAPENLTKQAWHELTDEEQTLANAIADKVIREWEQKKEASANA